MTITVVRVQVPLRVPRGTRGQNRPLVSFYDILKPQLIQRMRCTVIFRERNATFLLKNMSFLAELQPEIDLCIGIQTSCNIPGGSPTLGLPSE